jgi:hypothetical protein
MLGKVPLSFNEFLFWKIPLYAELEKSYSGY